MYQILIVEDEEIIRKTLPLIIDWAAIGFNVAGTVENGVEALKVLSKRSVDVVLTDIRMPSMNGLELACEIKSRYKNIKTILLSAYNEFEYARKGIEYGVYGYLLKSDDEEDIEKYFVKLKQVLDKEAGLLEEGSFGKNGSVNNRWISGEKFLKRIVINNGIENGDVIERAREYSIYLDSGKYLVSIFQIDEYELLKDSLDDNELCGIKEFILSYLFINIEAQQKGYVFRNQYLYIVLWTQINSDIGKYIENIFYDISDELDLFGKREQEITLTCTIGDIVDTITDIHCSYCCAKDLLDHKTYIGRGRLIDRSCVGSFKEEFDYFKIDEFSRQIIPLVNSGDEKEIIEYFQRLENYCVLNRVKDKMKITTLCTKILMLILEEIGKREDEVDTFVCKVNRISDIIKKHETISDILNEMELFILEISETLDRNGNENVRKIVEKAMEFIYDNYNRDISLKEVANYVNIHPVYLSKLFSSQMNRNYKSILTDVRIEKAKQLLLKIDKKVYEVSEAVGYKKPRYFSELFKKVTGLTPLEYREKYRR